MVVQLPYTWGYVDSINRIRRSTEKVVKVVGTRGNQKAISGGMGRVFRKKNEVTWNRTNFKRLGRVRVQVWETIFAIVVPVGLSSYIFGRRYAAHFE